jgi:hypothetical protein
MYLCGGHEVPCPDDTAGLHIRARDGKVVKATIGPDELAFQVRLPRWTTWACVHTRMSLVSGWHVRLLLT